MTPFRVWLRPLGENCRVRVDGIGNAKFLLTQLNKSPAIKAIGNVEVEIDSPQCTFLVPYHPSLSLGTFQRMLAAIPEVRLMLEPA
jgi:hypothetical protein